MLNFFCSQCISLLKQLAREGRTIVCTIHQPSARIFEMFDKLVILGEGRTIYRGTVKNLVPFLDSMGYRYEILWDKLYWQFPRCLPHLHTEVLYNTQNPLSQELLVAVSTATTSTLVAEFGGLRIYRLLLGKKTKPIVEISSKTNIK